MLKRHRKRWNQARLLYKHFKKEAFTFKSAKNLGIVNYGTEMQSMRQEGIVVPLRLETGTPYYGSVSNSHRRQNKWKLSEQATRLLKQEEDLCG